MEKIRIQRKEEDIYRINIADDGTEITFDLADIGLAIRVNKAFVDVEQNKNRAFEEIEMIKKKYVNQIQNEKLERAMQNETLIAYKKMYQKNRDIMDELFNCKGAMKKLFGDADYADMYDDLYEALAPHFEKMQLNTEKIKERIAKKYAIKEENVIQ